MGFTPPRVRSRQVWRSLYLHLRILGRKKSKSNRHQILFKKSNRNWIERKTTIVTSLHSNYGHDARDVLSSVTYTVSGPNSISIVNKKTKNYQITGCCVTTSVQLLFNSIDCFSEALRNFLCNHEFGFELDIGPYLFFRYPCTTQKTQLSLTVNKQYSKSSHTHQAPNATIQTESESTFICLIQKIV